VVHARRPYGNSLAQLNLGLLYLRGEGVQKSTAIALHWIGRAVDAEYPTALAALGYIYAIGQDVPQDLTKRLKLTRKASRSTVQKEKQVLGSSTLEGWVFPRMRWKL